MKQLVRQVDVAFFGKHRGWDDHIEGLGGDSPALTRFRQVLYVRGINGNVDAGTWDRIEEGKRLPGLHHVVVWCSGAKTVVGRLWPSVDGKGRSLYPMVVAIDSGRLSRQWVLREFVPRLADVEQACRAAADAPAVRELRSRIELDLRGVAESAGDVAASEPTSSTTFSRLLENPESGVTREGLLRVLYKMTRDMPPAAGRDSADAMRPTHLRLPVCAESMGEIVETWLGALRAQTQTSEVVFLRPIGKRWVDVILGEPSAEVFFCMQASAAALPLTTSIPYKFDEDFRQAAKRVLDAAIRGESLSVFEVPHGHSGTARKLVTMFGAARSRLRTALVLPKDEFISKD